MDKGQFDGSISPAKDGRRNANGGVPAFRDKSEHKQAEEETGTFQDQLHQSQEMEAIGQLTGGVAHDFNNSLTVIKGYCQLSLLEIKEGEPLKANIEEIQRAAHRAANLTRQLLAFSRRQILEIKILDLNAILRNLEKTLRRIIGEDIELITVLTDDLCRIKTDEGQIEQVIMNIAVNARDAMPKGRKLIIETANILLDEEYARNHVGVKPGQGTTFKIYFPRVDEPLEERKEKEKVGEIPHGHETVLVVEDEEEVRKLAIRLLQKQGYRVLEAPTGNEALLLCKSWKDPVHLLLVDVVMPGMSGWELVEKLRYVRGDFKALFMSGYTDNAIAHHGVLEKGVNYIQKPFTVEGLSRKVREILNK
jgi:CheY-like chemotaxis protein